MPVLWLGRVRHGVIFPPKAAQGRGKAAPKALRVEPGAKQPGF
jgi:hypothetical protein